MAVGPGVPSTVSWTVPCGMAMPVTMAVTAEPVVRVMVVVAGGEGGGDVEVSVGGQDADRVVRCVGEDGVAEGRDADGAGRVEVGGEGGCAVSGGALCWAAGEGGDRSAGGDGADALVIRVGDKEGAGGGEGEAARGVELRGGRGAVVAGVTGLAGACEGGNGTAGVRWRGCGGCVCQRCRWCCLTAARPEGVSSCAAVAGPLSPE